MELNPQLTLLYDKRLFQIKMLQIPLFTPT